MTENFHFGQTPVTKVFENDLIKNQRAIKALVCIIKDILVEIKNQEGTKNFIKQHFRTTATNTYTAPYKSLSITSFSDDVTVDGQPIPANFTINLEVGENEFINTNTVVVGTDYFVTIIK